MKEEDNVGCGKCLETATKSEGHRLMIAQTQGRYEPGEAHPQCQDCLENFLKNPELQKVKIEYLKEAISPKAKIQALKDYLKKEQNGGT